ncbi:MAG: hypothetical protein ABXS91_09705 [Sulfurimonas sp.]
MIRMLFMLMLFFSLSEAQFNKDFSFVGISASTETVNLNQEDPGHKTGFGLKYGQQSLEWRTTFALAYHQQSYHSFSVEIDKILLDEMFGTPKLRPYLGGTVGYLNYDEDELDVAYDETKGFYFGGNFGFIIYATDDIDVDLGYHYYKVQNLDFLDDLHGLTLAIHYFY